MGSQKSKTTQDTNQSFQQQQAQDTTQQQRQLQAQQQAQQGLQQLTQNFQNLSQQNSAQQQQQQYDSTARQATELPSFQQPVVNTYFQDLMGQYTSGRLAPQVYQDPRVAGFTPEQRQAQQMAATYATGGGTDYTNQALVAGKMLLDPNQILNPAAIPGLQASKEANATALMRQLTEQALPQVRGQALQSGGFGGSRQGIAEGLAIGRTGEAIANANAGMDMAAYSQGLQAMQNALGMLPSTVAAGGQPAQLLSQVGGQQQAQSQAEIDAARQRFQEEQAQPATTLGLLQSLMGVQGQYGGATVGQERGTQAGTQTGQATGQETGQQQQQQLTQAISELFGVNLSDLTEHMEGTASGTSQSNTRTVSKVTPSTLQTLGAIAAIALMPYTFGASAAAIPAMTGGGG